MTTIKFDRSVKYLGVRYDAHVAFKVVDSDVEQLKKAGAIVLSVDPVDPPQPEPEGKGEEANGVKDNELDIAQLKESLLTFTVAELTQFAQDNDIDLMGKTRKADIYNVIVAAL